MEVNTFTSACWTYLLFISRIGALEGDLCQRNHDFDNANRRIADLENQ